MHIALPQAQHLGGQREHLAVLRDETEMGEGQQIAAGGGAGQTRARGHLADGQSRALLVEGLDHRQALFQAGNEVALEGAAGLGGGRLGVDHLVGRGQIFEITFSGHGCQF